MGLSAHGGGIFPRLAAGPGSIREVQAEGRGMGGKDVLPGLCHEPGHEHVLAIHVARLLIRLVVIEGPAMPGGLVHAVGPGDGPEVRRGKRGRYRYGTGGEDRPDPRTGPRAGTHAARRHIVCKVIEGHSPGIREDGAERTTGSHDGICGLHGCRCRRCRGCRGLYLLLRTTGNEQQRCDCQHKEKEGCGFHGYHPEGMPVILPAGTIMVWIILTF